MPWGSPIWNRRTVHAPFPPSATRCGARLLDLSAAQPGALLHRDRRFGGRDPRLSAGDPADATVFLSSLQPGAGVSAAEPAQGGRSVLPQGDRSRSRLRRAVQRLGLAESVDRESARGGTALPAGSREDAGPAPSVWRCCSREKQRLPEAISLWREISTRRITCPVSLAASLPDPRRSPSTGCSGGGRVPGARLALAGPPALKDGRRRFGCRGFTESAEAGSEKPGRPRADGDIEAGRNHARPRRGRRTSRHWRTRRIQ